MKPSPGEPSAEDELWHAFGRAIGFTAAALFLLVGGGILLIVLAAAFFGFIYAH
ncbi:MAG TPA: hypothetical protein VFR68_06295 [Candidatus Dormibacteraeota bacterium]|nr:hypothetical protein [Candidatus Dormibacteraeota bacterium]